MKTIPPIIYLDNLIDDFGIWQHTDGLNILHEHGYALDDATRGLLFTLVSNKMRQSEILFSYIIKSQKDVGFYGFADSGKIFLPATASDDATGQSIWAAGFAYSKGFHKNESVSIVNIASMYLDTTKYMRGYAYALLGVIYINKTIAEKYFNKLKSYFDDLDDDWFWPESSITYGNGILAYAFLRYAIVYKNKESAALGNKILTFLESKCILNRQRGPIGNDSWLPRGENKVPIYSQQPIDTAYMIWAWVAAYQISQIEDDYNQAKLWMQWFEGKNVANTKMYNSNDLKCYDGINPEGVNFHSGAESNICLLLSKYMLENKTTI